MRKWLIIVAVVIILVFTGLFIAGTVDSNEPAEEQTTTDPQISTEQQTTTDPQISIEQQSDESGENITEESATPMTDDEIKGFYLKAHKLYAEWFSPVNNLVVDWDNITIINDREYFEVNSTEISSVEELKTEFKKYFDNKIIAETVDKYYIMYNGKMYGNAVLVEGGEVSETKHKMTVKNSTNTECVLTITSYIGDHKQDLDYRLRVIDGEWKFTGVFHWITMYDLVLE